MVNNKLIAHFDFIDGDLSIPILSDPTEIDTVQKFIPKTYKIVDDLPKSQTLLPDYETMSRQITYRTTKTQKTAMYIPQIKPINKSSYIAHDQWILLIASLTYATPDETCVDLNEIIRANLATEFNGSNPRFDQYKSLIVDFRITSVQLHGFLTKLQGKLMTCPSCRSVETVLKKGLLRSCQNCSATTCLPSLTI
jgi:hypothetical protein